MTTTDKITSSVMSCQIASNQLQEIRNTHFYRGVLKNKLNGIVPDLMASEKQFFDKFFEKSEDSTVDVYKVNEAFILKISKIPIYDMENISNMIDAYNKDKKSIEGIVNKILR